MKLPGANRSKNADLEEPKRKVKWIQEKPNVWRVIWAE
jgi:hypothetical protein